MPEARAHQVISVCPDFHDFLGDPLRKRRSERLAWIEPTARVERRVPVKKQLLDAVRQHQVAASCV
jgi:hypothetical protein